MLPRPYRCSMCGGEEGFRSRPRTLVERFVLPVFLLKPTRCAECFNRDYIFLFTPGRERSEKGGTAVGGLSLVKKRDSSALGTLVAGLLVVAPIYLSVLLLLKAMGSLIGLVEPIAKLLPEWLPGAQIIALLLVLTICFLAGLAISTPAGRAIRRHIEVSVLQKIPGYSLLRDLTERLAGEKEGNAWKPALVEIEDALVPGFVIEELDDGRLTVFVPSVPTPFAGAIYILTSDRVHPVDVPFTQAVSVVTKWGAGSKDLIAATERRAAG
jgi:uncharacterized membrane protein